MIIFYYHKEITYRKIYIVYLYKKFMPKKGNYMGIVGRLADKIKNSLLTKIAAYSLAGSIAFGSSSLVGCGSEHKPGIENIKEFLEKCPTNDPIYEQIRNDFEIRKNGRIVKDVQCSEPISQMPTSQYTDELITLQVLRTIYYMDYGRSSHLPWTTTTAYQWMKSKIGGITINDQLGGVAAFCCMSWKNRPYIAIVPLNETREQRKYWGGAGLAEIVGVYMHETRHVDGFPHVECSGELKGAICDQTYDEKNLSPSGIQWWLQKNWLDGNLYIGFSCLDPKEKEDIANYHLNTANRYRDRFVNNKPPILTMPEFPGGICKSKK